MVLVDSSVWIEASRRQGDLAVKVVLRALLDDYEAAFCSPIKLEVLGGARREERRAMESLFNCLPYWECVEADWKAAKELAWQLRDRGITLPWNDVLIAAMARRRDERVYAQDAHFEEMAKLGIVRLYRPGYGGSFSPDDD